MEVGGFSLGQRDNFDIRESHPLEPAGNFFLIAGQPVHCFGQHKLEATTKSVGDQALNTRANECGPGYCVIAIFFDDFAAS